MRARRLALAWSVAAVAVMTGCAGGHGEPSIRPTESRDRMKSFVDRSEAALGSTGWRDLSGPVIQGCPLGDGRDGFNYGYTRLGPGSEEIARDVAVMDQFWRSQGYKTSVVPSSNPKNKAVQVFAVGDAIRTIGLSVDSEYTAFSVESECIPGDVGQIIEGGDF